VSIAVTQYNRTNSIISEQRWVKKLEYYCLLATGWFYKIIKGTKKYSVASPISMTNELLF
jgi:hypothetical protein